MTLIRSLIATVIVSLIALIGVISFAINQKLLDRIILLMIGFAAGSMIGASFLHLLPESLEHCASNTVFLYVVAGFGFFFIMERYLYWRHCHKGVCDLHVFTYLNLIGDALHNFMDGMVIAIAFLSGTSVGIVTTLAIIFHELPQELGDFGVLVYGGFTKTRALAANFLCALTAVMGAVAGYALSGLVSGFSAFLMPFCAGGFIYIAASDLVPELHKQKETKRANLSLIAFFAGIILMWIVSGIHSR